MAEEASTQDKIIETIGEMVKAGTNVQTHQFESEALGRAVREAAKKLFPSSWEVRPMTMGEWADVE